MGGRGSSSGGGSSSRPRIINVPTSALAQVEIILKQSEGKVLIPLEDKDRPKRPKGETYFGQFEPLASGWRDKPSPAMDVVHRFESTAINGRFHHERGMSVAPNGEVRVDRIKAKYADNPTRRTQILNLNSQLYRRDYWHRVNSMVAQRLGLNYRRDTVTPAPKGRKKTIAQQTTLWP